MIRPLNDNFPAGDPHGISAEAESTTVSRPEPPTLEEIDRLRVRGARPLTDAILEQARRQRR